MSVIIILVVVVVIVVTATTIPTATTTIIVVVGRAEPRCIQQNDDDTILFGNLIHVLVICWLVCGIVMMVDVCGCLLFVSILWLYYLSYKLKHFILYYINISSR